MKLIKVKGQKLKVESIIEAGSGKVTAVLEGGQQITYRPPAADLIRDAFKPVEEPAKTEPVAVVAPPVEQPAEKPAKKRFGSIVRS